MSKDMFGCRNNGVRGGVPDFVTKAFNIVTDPNTDSIISWSLSGDSFIIWDHIKFSAEILPRYFKHNNFSSFVYQLNNYGFRKIGVDHQWEYENPNFQSGKENLLANIKRRGQNRQKIITLPSCDRTINNNNNGAETKSEILKNEIIESKLEIENLKRKQTDLEFQITAFETEVKNIESKSKKLLVIWAKACDEIFAQKKENEARKEIQENNGLNPGIGDFDGKNCNLSSENQSISSSGDSGIQNIDSEVGMGNNSADYNFWKKILQEDDDETCEINEAETEMGKKQAKIALDLEGLIAKMADQENEEVNTTL